MVFKEHGLMLYLAPELQIALATLQSKEKLGRSYAGLKALSEGFYRLGVLSEADYKILIEKYSEGLEKSKPLTMEQLQTKTEQDKMTRKFSLVLDQWHLHKDKKWRDHWVREAEIWKDKVPNAKLVLDLQESP